MKHQNKIREEEAWEDQIPGTVALELYPQPTQVSHLLPARYGSNQIWPVWEHRPWASPFSLLLPQVHLVVRDLPM